VSPILVRPVREQLEHDRIIRLLQTRSRRKYDAGINPGAEQNVAVGSGPSAVYPDVVLTSLERGRKLEGIIEVETGESVNHLEALAEWAHFARLRAPFHLYVPSGMVDVARRLCDDNQIIVNEIWSYHAIGEDVRFALVHRARETQPPARRPAPAAPVRPAAPGRPAAPARPAAAPRRKAVSAGASKPVARAAKGSSRKSARAERARPARKTASGRSQKRK
jgi:hypothetical protein